MAELPLLSASSVTTFLRCGMQWYYGYVAAVKSPPSLKQARGVAVHKAVEVNMRQKITTRVDMPIDDVADAYATEFDVLSDDIESDRHEIGDYKDSGIKLTRLHTKTIAPEIQPVWVEQPVQFKINDIPFSGQVDLLDDESRIRDTKTTARKPTADSYILNMTGYALSYRQITGTIETDTVLDYLVATKQPYYLPIMAGGPVSDEEIVRFANIVESVAFAIKAGRFVPNGLASGACSWCGYKNICPAYQRRGTTVVDFDVFGLAPAS
jgi:RecB family exonuclease